MQNSYKIAISIPGEDFRGIEKIRRKMGISRSSLIARAVRYWINRLQEKELIQMYEKGYKRNPEEVSDLKIYETLEFESLSPKEEWDEKR